jgi:hypothetical protein
VELKINIILLSVLVFFMASISNMALEKQIFKDTTIVKKEITVESDDLGMFGVSIKPNPARKFIKVSFDPELFRGDIKIIISDKNGKKVFEKMYKKDVIKDSRVKIDVETLKKGLYKVEIVTLEVSLELAFIKR